MKICKIILIISVLCICCSKYLFAESQRFIFDLNFKIPLDVFVQGKMKELQVLIEEMKPYMIEASNTEPVKTATHICKHDEGLPCEAEVDIKDLNVDIIKVKPTPTLSPKPTPK